MPIRPKFVAAKESKPSSFNRPFTDRDEYIEIFKNTIVNHSFKEYKILVYFGLGGIGKTTLRKELCRIIDNDYKNVIWTCHDFDLQSYRNEETALYSIQKSLRDKYKVKFNTFDLAYAVYWQKTHPQTQLTKESLPLLHGSEVLINIISSLGVIPMVGLIPKVAKAFISGHKYLRTWWIKRGQKELYDLPDLEAKEILERFPMYLASDLKDHINTSNNKSVIFLDTYEALWEHYKEGTYNLVDEWIRELVAQLPEVLWVICGREKLRWEKVDKDWVNYLEQILIGNLSENDTKYYLDGCGIINSDIQKVIINTSKGVPHYLSLAVDTYYEINDKQNHEPKEDDFAKTQAEVLNRFLRYLDKSEIETLKVLSNAKFWDKEIFELLVTEFKTYYPVTAFNKLCRFSFISQLPGKQFFEMHSLMREGLISKQDESQILKVNNFLFNFYNDKLKSISSKNIDDHYKEIFIEAYHHGKLSLDIKEFYDWFIFISAPLLNAAQVKILLPVAEEILHLIKSKISEEGIEYANVMYILSKLYEIDGNYTEAKYLMKKVLDIQRNILGNEHPDYAKSLNFLALLYELLGKFKKAETLSLESLNIRKKTLGEDNTDYADSLIKLSNIYDAMGIYDKTESLILKAKEILEKTSGEINHNYSYSLQSLASLYKKQGQFQKAEQLLNSALSINKALYGEVHHQYILNLESLADLYYYIGKYEKSEELYHKTLELNKSVTGENHPQYTFILQGLCDVYRRTIRYDKAEDLYKKVLNINQNILGEVHPNYALALCNLASLYIVSGYFQKAFKLYEQALEIYKNILSEDHPSCLITECKLASLYAEFGNFQKSEELYNINIPKFKIKLGTENPHYANLIFNQAVLYKYIKKLDEAESLQIESLKIVKEIMGVNHPDYIIYFSNLTDIYVEAGKIEKAYSLLNENLTAFTESLGIKHPFIAEIIYLFGKVEIEMNKFDVAENHLKNSLSILHSINNINPIKTINILIALAKLYYKKNDFQISEDYFKEALKIRLANTPKHPDIRYIYCELLNLYNITGNKDKEKEIVSKLILYKH